MSFRGVQNMLNSLPVCPGICVMSVTYECCTSVLCTEHAQLLLSLSVSLVPIGNTLVPGE